MKSTWILLLTLALLSLCARTAPLPPDTSSSSRHSIPHPSRPSTKLSRPFLYKRGEVVPSTASNLEQAAEDAVATTKKKDWKRPIAITISAVGLVMTVGWNYISAQSFFSNRAKYYREKKRLEAEKSKPPPQVGDTVCTVEAYYTPDQVETRKPSRTRSPCYVMSQQGGAAGQTTAQQNTVQQQGGAVSQQPGGVVSQQPGGVVSEQPGGSVSPGVGASSDSLTAMLSRDNSVSGGRQPSDAQQESQPPMFFPASQGVTPNVAPGSSSSFASTPAPVSSPYSRAQVGEPLNKRGLGSAAGAEAEAAHEIQEAAHEIKQLSDVARARFARPGFAVARTSQPGDHSSMFDDLRSPGADSLAEDEEKVKPSSPRPKSWWKKMKSAKKVSTEDITFGLTVLNTIGNIPSLILTTINAYYYRGNPKVD
ncbi:hypothetical protein [Sporisorium scitamineum]|uniref:Transmembrane protein n=1 Tax=Sporisorium scitamineum TaxID=49012 RepID=A0A0F7RVU4_9BASI|nr:hypothetical protein [Sporisorium scitamineum]